MGAVAANKAPSLFFLTPYWVEPSHRVLIWDTNQE